MSPCINSNPKAISFFPLTSLYNKFLPNYCTLQTRNPFITMFENSSSQQQHDFTLEITVVSAQGLKTSSSLFSHRIRPFITLTSFPPSSFGGDKSRQVYKTKVDDHGGVNPTWGDKFYVPIDDNFFANPYSCVYLQLFTKRLISGHSQLGWFQIPAADVGLPPVGSVRQLSYRLRSEDGTRTQGIVNVAVKLDGPAPAPVAATPQQLPDDPCQTVIGIPVSYATWNGNGS